MNHQLTVMMVVVFVAALECMEGNTREMRYQKPYTARSARWVGGTRRVDKQLKNNRAVLLGVCCGAGREGVPCRKKIAFFGILVWTGRSR